jgi:glyoxylase-like metal-dependent hydrolase (beta-lactamase superfamily II)
VIGLARTPALPTANTPSRCNPPPYRQGVEIVTLGPRLHLIRPVFGQAYLWRDDDGVTLVDTGIPGSEPAFAAAFDELGLARADLRRVVITHGHEDHTGSAAALRAWGDVAVFAHRADAPIVRGLRRRAEPTLTAAEEPIYAQVTADMPAVPPCPVDVELGDGDTIDFGGGARVIATPGHTDGSIAVALPRHGVLFTGDLVANGDTGLLLGPFNTDRGQARVSFAALSQVQAETVCFGHGDPLVGPDGASAWRRLGERCAAARDAVPDPLG